MFDLFGFNNHFFPFESDEQAKRLQKSPTPSQLRVTPCEGDDSLDPDGNQGSIVKIMVESPKEPPNVEFGVAFPQPAVVRIKTETTQDIEQTDGQTSSTAVTLATDIQEPIDVNIPRDTTNIFYAYEETEIDNSFQQQQQPQQSEPTLDTPSVSTDPVIEHDSVAATADTHPNNNNNNQNQSVNIEQDDTNAPNDPSQSDNHATNQISSDNCKSSS